MGQCLVSGGASRREDSSSWAPLGGHAPCIPVKQHWLAGSSWSDARSPGGPRSRHPPILPSSHLPSLLTFTGQASPGSGPRQSVGLDWTEAVDTQGGLRSRPPLTLQPAWHSPPRAGPGSPPPCTLPPSLSHASSRVTKDTALPRRDSESTGASAGAEAPEAPVLRPCALQRGRGRGQCPRPRMPMESLS